MSECFNPIPFGCSIPIQNPHAVSVSLPLLQNVIDYEEGNEVAVAKMQSGYPRFFQNKFVEKLVEFIRNKHSIASDKVILPIASIHAKSILEYLVQTQFEFIEDDNNVFLVLENNPDLVKKCSDYIRNVGLLISSRKAENTLYNEGKIDAIFEEEVCVDDPSKIIKNVLSKAYNNVLRENILLANCGMNALFSASETISRVRKSENRSTVIQLGWLYVDTMEIIEKRNTAFHLQINIYNKLQLEHWLESNHYKVSTLITEISTNPLIQCVDLPWLFQLCKKYDIILIVDATIATPFNVDVLSYCDIAIESLTKFACGSGDLLMGAIILNENSRIVQSNKNEFQKFIIPPFEGELNRLAFQIKGYEKRVKIISKNAQILYNYLKGQPFVKEIYSAFHPDSVDNFLKIRKSEDSFPGLLSIVFDEDFECYYNELQLAKGPSLGTEFTLAMPYVYLAHYEYLKTNEGKQKLLKLGMNSNLLRLSVGVEPVKDIISVFEKMKINSLNFQK